MPSSTVEDYIKQIYLETERSGRRSVPTGRIAEALGVVPGTTTTMVKALADSSLVVYAPRQGVELTASGRRLALHVLRRHRLIEQFLVEVLGFDWSEVHEEAERLEHVVSDAVLERIDRYLGYPTEDPHGDPIPTAAGWMSPRERSTLSECPLDTRLIVARIGDQNTDFLRFVGRSGLNPGVAIRVTERNPSADALVMEVGDGATPLTLGLGAAAKVLVRAPE